MPKVSESLSAFLCARKTAANADLIERWSIDMETQVNVSSAGGTPVDGKRSTYTDGVNEWFQIRIPHGANSEPEWRDYELRWPLDLHVEGIGLTGWNWKDRCSEFVGFDVDSITGHAAGVGISDAELTAVKNTVQTLPYVEVRRSTSGRGLHLYVHLDNVPTANHTEHAALARCILGMMSSECNFDFASQVDACGGVLWVYHTKANGTDGLQIIKGATKRLAIADLPSNWRDHVAVVTRQRTRIKIDGVADTDKFETLASSRRRVPLDDTHKAIIDELSRSGFSTVWVPEHHLLQTHTKALADLVGYKGCFKTNSEGRNPGTCNCFAYPLEQGAWRVYRFSPGTAEAETWEQDGNGWTNCCFNKLPDLRTAATAAGGVESPNNGGFVFATAEEAVKTVAMMGQELVIPEAFQQRETRLKAQKDGRVVLSIVREKNEEPLSGWLNEKGRMSRVLNLQAEVRAQAAEETYSENDKLIRALTSTANKHIGFVAREQNGQWIEHPKDNVKNILMKHGNAKADAEIILGAACFDSWKLVNLPFQPEYPGDRQWNREAAQYSYAPGDGEGGHPHWDLILRHCFSDLDAAIKEMPWAQKNNIQTGADYGLLWAACLLRAPFQPLPYLFFYGGENCGKSTYHESLALLMTKGVVCANAAILSQSNFNGELAGMLLAFVEELDISKTPGALAKIKDWVVSPTLLLRKMRTDAYTLPNTLHFIQVANHPEYCPIFPGDTRITMVFVPPLPDDTEIPRTELQARLRAEGPNFLRTLLDLPLPAAEGRLRIPIVATENKERIQHRRKDPLSLFVNEMCHRVNGSSIPLERFCTRFRDWLPADEQGKWATSRVLGELGDLAPVGADRQGGRALGNLSFEKPPASAKAAEPLRLVDGRLQ
jgi:hypothetical protein